MYHVNALVRYEGDALPSHKAVACPSWDDVEKGLAFFRRAWESGDDCEETRGENADVRYRVIQEPFSCSEDCKRPHPGA